MPGTRSLAAVFALLALVASLLFGCSEETSSESGSSSSGSADAAPATLPEASSPTPPEASSPTPAPEPDASSESDAATDANVPPTEIDDGTLVVTVTDAPDNAVVSVTGPNGFAKSFAATTTLTALAPGAYTVSSAPAIKGGYTYTPSITGSSATVENGTTANAAVTFAQSNGAPTISAIANQSTTVTTPTAAIAFTIGDAEDAVADLTVTASLTDTHASLGTTLAIAGSTAARTLTIAPDGNAGVRQVTITVTDSHGAQATTSFFVTVDVTSGPSPIVTSELESATTEGTLKYVVANVAADAVVTFAPNVHGKTITFTSAGGGTLGFSKNVTIWGPGASLVAVSGNDKLRVFANSTSTVAITLHGLTIRNGNATGSNGGALNNNGIATVTSCVFMNNQAINVGGAINSSRTLTVDGCSFVGNYAPSGGTVYQNSNGSATIRNSLFSANLGPVNGVGVAASTANITNCTITSPVTDGGTAVMATSNATLRVSHSTLVGTTGLTVGVLGGSSGTVVLKGNILSAFGSAITPSSTTVTSLGGNTLDAADPDFTAQPTDAVGVALGLDPLGSYGGLTQTIRLKATSSAIDRVAGPCTDAQGNAIVTDQRGFARPAGASCDSGAFERQTTD